MNDYIDAETLTKRWGLTTTCLAIWRCKKQGCRFIKVKNLVLYKLSDVEEYERKYWYVTLPKKRK